MVYFGGNGDDVIEFCSTKTSPMAQRNAADDICCTLHSTPGFNEKHEGKTHPSPTTPVLR